MYCHTEIEAADQTFYLTLSQYADTGPTSPIAETIMARALQGSHWSTNFEVTGMTRPGKQIHGESGSRTHVCGFGGGRSSISLFWGGGGGTLFHFTVLGGVGGTLFHFTVLGVDALPFHCSGGGGGRSSIGLFWGWTLFHFTVLGVDDLPLDCSGSGRSSI